MSKAKIQTACVWSAEISLPHSHSPRNAHMDPKAALCGLRTPLVTAGPPSMPGPVDKNSVQLEGWSMHGESRSIRNLSTSYRFGRLLILIHRVAKRRRVPSRQPQCMDPLCIRQTLLWRPEVNAAGTRTGRRLATWARARAVDEPKCNQEGTHCEEQIGNLSHQFPLASSEQAAWKCKTNTDVKTRGIPPAYRSQASWHVSLACRVGDDFNPTTSDKRVSPIIRLKVILFMLRDMPTLVSGPFI